MPLMAWCRVVKTYSHPAMHEIALTAVMQALSDPCRLAIVRELLEAKGRALACNEVRLNISLDVSKLVMEAIEKERENRYRNAEEMERAIAAGLGGGRGEGERRGGG